MKPLSSKLSYFCCFFSLFGAVVCAFAHDFWPMILNFVFSIVNWYVAEHNRAIEEQNEKSGKRDNDTEDKE
jgi:hypothetical protein